MTTDDRALRMMGVSPLPLSARLRQAEAELAETKLALAGALDDRDFIGRELEESKAKLSASCGSCHPCDAYGAEQDRDLARAELASARQELALWRRYTPEESS